MRSRADPTIPRSIFVHEGGLAIAATGVKVQVLYQVIEPLDSSLPGRLLASGASSSP
jgi:hypothetical protein